MRGTPLAAIWYDRPRIAGHFHKEYDVDICSLLSPIFDIMQFQYNAVFFWANWVGFQVPNARTLFGGLLGCSA